MDGELLALVLEADESALAKGDSPSQRAFNVVTEVAGKLFLEGAVLMGAGAPPQVLRIHELVKQLYRPEDIAAGGVHLGLFMFRDVYARLSVPVIMGEVRIDPLDHVDLSAIQKRWLQRRESDLRMLWDQFVDLFDFGYGLMEPKAKLPELSDRFLGLAHFQLQAAAATLTGAYHRGGAVQSALLAIELMLKGVLAARGYDESRLRKLGHDLGQLAAQVATLESGFDADRVARTIAKFPPLVTNRYDASQPNRVEAGRIVMGAQYVAAESMRQLSDRNFRDGMDHLVPRSWPA